MAKYIEYSTRIYNVYLKYVAPEDMYIYSIDEVFIDISNYLKSYKKSAHELALTIIRDVLKTTGITATAGIGTNMYLAKIAMDIKAKKMQADKDGLRIAELDECAKVIIDERLRYAVDNPKKEVAITFFVPDEKKTGGAYLRKSGFISKFLEYERKIVFDDKIEIPIDEIVNIDIEELF